MERRMFMTNLGLTGITGAAALAALPNEVRASSNADKQIQVFESLSSLRTNPNLPQNELVYVEGYYTAGDEGHGFYRLLNRMLFRAAAPDERYRVMQRFYRLRQPLIERFYAGASTWYDRVRILTGKPPVPIQKAIPCVSERRALTKERILAHGHE